MIEFDPVCINDDEGIYVRDIIYIIKWRKIIQKIISRNNDWNDKYNKNLF